MADYADIAVKAPVATVQGFVQQAFMANGFQVQWASALKGKAEKGSAAANILVGGFAQYYAVDFEVFPGQQDSCTLRLTKSNTGLAGGLWGMSKVNKQFNKLVETLAAWFYQQGSLRVAVKK